jgi:tetratricopeptide (TPR) repeat protein
MRRLAPLLLAVFLSAPARLAGQSPDSLLSVIRTLEAAGRWRDAIDPLQRYLVLRPDDPDRLHQLGLYLAWRGDRGPGTELLRRSVALRPDQAEWVAALGEVLSWDPARRNEAGDLFRRALQIDPTNARAREGEANLLAWSGRANEALPRYDALLVENPRSVGALRGKGGALNQLQRFDEAATVLGQAVAIAPDDAGTLQELAASHVGLEEFDRAQARLGAMQGVESPELRLLQDTTRRARGSYLEGGGMLRTRSDQLDAARGDLKVSPYLGSGVRLQGGWQHTRFEDSLGAFNSDVATAGLRYRHDRRFEANFDASLRWTDGVAGTAWAGNVGLGWRPAPALRLTVGGDRSLVEETRQSVLGSVHANLGTVGAELVLLGRRVEVSGHLVGGVYTGLDLEDNTRLGADFMAGWVVRAYQPYLRLSYGFMGTRFDYNAGSSAATAPDQVGGYFSPSRFYLNYGAVTASQRFGQRVFWEFNGALGGQVVREQEGGTGDVRVAASINTHLTWRMGRRTDLDLRYQYADAFAAFRLHEARLVLRQYF